MPESRTGVDAGKRPRCVEPDFDGSAVPGKVFQAPLVVSADCSARRGRALAVIEQKLDIAFALACMASLRLAVGMRRYTAHVAASRGGQDHAIDAEATAFPSACGTPGAARSWSRSPGGAHRCDLARGANLSPRRGVRRRRAALESRLVTAARPTKAARGEVKLRRKLQLFGCGSHIGIAGGFGRHCEDHRRGK